MDRARVNYEEKTVIHELTQGIQMAKQLIRVNLHSPEARDLLMKNILSSYEKALFLLKSPDSSGHQPPAPAPPAPSLPESTGSPGSGEFEFDKPFSHQQGENVILKKRKWSTTREDQVSICSDNGLEGNNDDGYSWRKNGQKDISDTNFPGIYHKKQEILSSHHHQSSPPNPGAMLSNLRASLSVDTSDLDGVTVPSSFSSPSTSTFGLMEDNYYQFQYPNCYVDDLWQVYSPPIFISPATSESNLFTEWGSSPSSLDFPDVDSDFEFMMNSLF